MTPDEWAMVFEAAMPLVQPILVAIVTGGLAFGGSCLLYRQAERRRRSDEQRWGDQKFRDETFRAVVQLIEAIAEYDDALTNLQSIGPTQDQGTPSSALAEAKDRVTAADRDLNRIKQVAEVFIEHKDSGVAESIRELRRRYEDARIAVFYPDSRKQSEFSDIVNRQKEIRASVQDGIIRILRSYSPG